MAGYIGSKASVVSSGAERKKTFAITTSTTSLTGLSYTPTKAHVFHNGVRLVDGTDYTATNGTSITLTSAAENGDQVVVVSYATFQVADAYTQAEADAEFVAKAGDTMTGGLTIDNTGATVLTVDRATSDGTIIDVQKGGTTVGSIGAYNGDVYLGNGDTGITFADGSDVILPVNASTPAYRDAAVSLGNSSYRFKDLYLSGGVYLGGTGAANKLDDYEEGTWTPVIRGSGGDPSVTYTTANTGGIYTKIGDTVFVSFEVRWSSITGGGGIASISGLPFTRSSTGTPDGDRSTFDFYNVTVPSGGISPVCSAGTNQAVLNLSFTRSGTTTTGLQVSNLINTNPGFIRASLVYKV